MTEIRSATLPLREPGFHVAIVAAFSVGDREQKAFAPVEETAAQDVGAKERPQAVADAARERDLAARRDQHRGAGTGIAVDARSGIFQPDHGAMLQGFAQAREHAVADDALVYEVIREPPLAA